MMEAVHSGGTVGSIIQSLITRFGDRTAIADDSKCWTYRELGDAIARFVAVYKNMKIGKGNAISVLSENRVESLAAICASFLVGARYTPLNPMAAEDELAFIVNDAKIDLLIVGSERFARRGLAIRQRAPALRDVAAFGEVHGIRNILSDVEDAIPAPLSDDADPELTALLAYTGGTTGRSRGVVLSHRAVLATSFAMSADWDWPVWLRFLATTPISHATGVMLVPVLMRGGFVRISNGFNPEAFIQLVRSEAITATFLVPTMIYALIDYAQGHPKPDLSCLQTVIYGSAPISPDRLQEAIEIFGPIFMQMYGQMEAPQVIATLRKVDHDKQKPSRFGSCGRANAMLSVKLLNSEMNEVGVGEPGEICVRGPIVMDGYWKDDAATEEALRGGWLHTGDVAVADEEGYLYIVDRIKDMIISGGFNIYPREVEDVLMSYPAVASAAVIGVPDEKWGEAVKCFVVPKSGAVIDVNDLRTFVKEKRGAPWAPKSVEIAENIPLTNLGKIDRQALRAPYWKESRRGVA
jgi:fatty-acyl-CoA synthase